MTASVGRRRRQHWHKKDKKKRSTAQSPSSHCPLHWCGAGLVDLIFPVLSFFLQNRLFVSIESQRVIKATVSRQYYISLWWLHWWVSLLGWWLMTVGKLFTFPQRVWFKYYMNRYTIWKQVLHFPYMLCTGINVRKTPRCSIIFKHCTFGLVYYCVGIGTNCTYVHVPTTLV